MWSVSPQYNYSISYISTSRLQGVKVYIGGIIPQSSTPYLIVQWDPFLEPVYHVSGQWNVEILSNINGTNPSVVAGWIGIGTGFIYPNPGDRINVTVTYDPSTNTLSGVVTDLNLGQSVSFTMSLSGYFTPPSSGNYVFGVGSTTGWGYANWALLYVAMIGNVKSPSPTYYSVNSSMTNSVEPSHSALLTWVAVAVIVVLVLVIALLMVRRSKQ
jgi:hypothetical protein